MSKEEKKFTDEEKSSIALKAVSGGDEAVEELSKKHGISKEQIRSWINETGVANVENQEEEVTLEASEEFIDSVEYQATRDTLNYRRLIFWSVFGIAFVGIIVQALIFIHGYTQTSVTRVQAEQSLYYDFRQLQQNEQSKLESFGVVDPEEGIYRIPIDSAITLIANE